MRLDEVRPALERLAKWRAHFAGWQLGTRGVDDPECQAVRDHREVTLLLRAELNALMGLLVAKGIIAEEEWTLALGEEAERMQRDYERRWPGARATDSGMAYDRRSATWMSKWKP